MLMDRHALIRLFGFRAGFWHGDTLLQDRWRWLKRRLPETANGERLLDVGCGSGAFTVAAAKLGYAALGTSWSEEDLGAAAERAKISKVDSARFVRLDVRQLGTMEEWKGSFDVVVCLETIEHVLHDRALVEALYDCLTPGGRLLLSTPYYLYHPITAADKGPFEREERGWHVRRGYTPAMLEELCKSVGFYAEEISYCSGLLSQKVTWLMRRLEQMRSRLGWIATLPFRPGVALLDGLVTRLLGWPHFSICLVAYKPRYNSSGVMTPRSAC